MEMVGWMDDATASSRAIEKGEDAAVEQEALRFRPFIQEENHRDFLDVFILLLIRVGKIVLATLRRFLTRDLAGERCPEAVGRKYVVTIFFPLNFPRR